MKRWALKVLGTFFSALGVPGAKGNPALMRDVALGLPVVTGEFLAAVPLLYLMGGTHITNRIWIQAAIGLAGAIGISLISPNWNILLAAGWGFLVLRALIALVAGGGLGAVVLTAAFLSLVAVCAFVLKPRSKSG